MLMMRLMASSIVDGQCNQCHLLRRFADGLFWYFCILQALVARRRKLPPIASDQFLLDEDDPRLIKELAEAAKKSIQLCPRA